ncbi:MAG: PIN domain-containing protein [Desulfobacterales bacterium]|nr:PIN domain-containing protein [Desulfobacterales bacterium]
MYLLDTNILSELIKKRPDPLFIQRLSRQPPENLFTSSICVMELRMGSALRDDYPVFWKRIEEQILSRINILPIGEEEAKVAGDILATLRKAGQWIGIEDVLIAATAICNRLTAVTANTGHFSRVDGLHVENWLEGHPG